MQNNTKIMIIATIFLFLVVAFALWIIYTVEYEKGEGELFVIDVIDGDTFKMSDNTVVRMLCINTPEADEPNYERAAKFLESLILYKEVRLVEGDTLNSTDKYGRELRFVYVDTSAGEVFVNG